MGSSAATGFQTCTGHRFSASNLAKLAIHADFKDTEEDHPVTVPAGFDPAAIKLIGNVTGQAPIRGLLRHRGWRVCRVTLPSLPQGSGRAIVAPAEVEVA